GSSHRNVQRHGGANERLQRLFVNLVALMKVDGAPHMPSRLELKRSEGSLSEAPLAKVSFTTALYVSPVQMMPACDHTGTPSIEFEVFLHFPSSTTAGAAFWMTPRRRASVSPRQSPSSLILCNFGAVLRDLIAFVTTRVAVAFFSTFADFLGVLSAIVFTPL